MRESEGRIKSILRAAPIGIGVVANRVILQVNRRMCEMVGYSEAELVGKDSRMIYESDDDYNHVGKVKYDQIKKKGTGTVETRFKRKDGKVIEVLISSTPLDLNDLSAGITFTALDITERKRIEQERERLNQKLLKKNKELEQIIYATSHDLRSPLVNIQGFSKELNYSVDELISDLSVNDIPKNIKKKISNILEQEIPESMKFIGDSITKMDLLLSGLLRLSRIGREEIHLERLDMTELISSVVNNFEFLIKEKNIRVEIERLPECMGDKSQINQVFSNLLDNAIKYLKNDISGVIEFSGFKKKDQIVYCVEDNGIGISGNDHEKIFGFFYQADPDKSLGEGLGLTIVNRIIERHNGKVWVESQAGKGSKFCVSLPNI